MKAFLVEGVAGSGKTNHIANYVDSSPWKTQALLLTFSRTGRDVMRRYLDDRKINNKNVHTIDSLAIQILLALGDTRFVVTKEYVIEQLLPELYEHVLSQYQQSGLDGDLIIPNPTPATMQALMLDIDFYRASGAFEYNDDDSILNIVSGQLHHDWRLVKRLFYAYDNYRETWVPPRMGVDHHAFFEGNESRIAQKGEQGFRTVSESVYDLLSFVDDGSSLARIGANYPLVCIDEFHDTSPLQLKFILALSRDVEEVMAVGDRFQNIFTWRGTNTSVVFDQFVKQLSATLYYLNKSYRYANAVAKIASAVVHRPISSEAPHRTSVSSLDEKGLAKLNRETVIISRDYIDQLRMAFHLFTHTKHKLALGIHHSTGVAILNILFVLRYRYLLDSKHLIVKGIGLDLAAFLALPVCHLPEVGKKEMLEKPSVESLMMYFSIHLQSEEAYSPALKNTLLYWLSTNMENTKIADVMQWFEERAQLWSLQANKLYRQYHKTAWDSLKKDAQTHGYLLKEWGQRVEQLYKRWSTKSGLRFVTVAQAKGQEYEHVLLTNANHTGFVGKENGEQQDNLFYVGLTRVRKQLSFYQLPDAIAYLENEKAAFVSEVATQRIDSATALNALREIKNKLLTQHNNRQEG